MNEISIGYDPVLSTKPYRVTVHYGDHKVESHYASKPHALAVVSAYLDRIVSEAQGDVPTSQLERDDS